MARRSHFRRPLSPRGRRFCVWSTGRCVDERHRFRRSGARPRHRYERCRNSLARRRRRALSRQDRRTQQGILVTAIDMRLVTIEAIEAAARVLEPVAVRTPLLPADALSEKLGVPVYIKPEMLQRGGAFKFRGAYNF